MAAAIYQNTSLTCFEWFANYNAIGDATGKALASALQQNTTLKSFTLKALFTKIGIQTCKALFAAISRNMTLMSFYWRTEFEDEPTVCIKHLIVDNRILILQRQVVRQLTKLSWQLGFQSVKSAMFWNVVLEFFARPGCFGLPMHV